MFFITSFDEEWRNAFAFTSGYKHSVPPVCVMLVT